LVGYPTAPERPNGRFGHFDHFDHFDHLGVPEAVLGVIWTPNHSLKPSCFDYNRGHMEVFWVILDPWGDPPGGPGDPWERSWGVPLPGFQRNRGVGVPGVTPG